MKWKEGNRGKEENRKRIGGEKAQGKRGKEKRGKGKGEGGEYWRRKEH